MQPASGPPRGLQLALIGGVGVLFFLATFGGDAGVAGSKRSTFVLAAACVAVLAGIFILARRAGAAATAGVAPQRERAPRETAAIVIGTIALMFAPLTAWAGVASAVIFAGVLVWRRRLR